MGFYIVVNGDTVVEEFEANGAKEAAEKQSQTGQLFVKCGVPWKEYLDERSA